MTAARIAGAIAGAAAAVSAFAITAHAELITLTPQQTVALYGSSIPATYYDGESDITYNLSFDYAFPLSSIGWGDGGLSVAHTWPSSPTTSGLRTQLTSGDAAVYVASATQWGGGTFVPWANSAGHVNVSLSPSISLTDIDRWQQNILYTVADNWSGDAGGTPLERGCVASEGRLTVNASFGEPVLSLTGGSGGYVNDAVRPCMAYLPTYAHAGGTVDESQLATVTGWLCDITQSDVDFSVSGWEAQLTWCGTAGSASSDIWLILGCPTIGNYVIPPPITTPAPVTSRPDYTAETGQTYTTGITIDNLSAEMQELIRNQRWQLYYEEIMVRNQNVQNETLRQILYRLDDIYNKMDILQRNPINTDSPMWQEMADALTGMTTNTMPNYVLQGLTFWADCSQEILIRYDFLVPLGAFALTMLVIYYVLFKGRTS